MKRKKIIFSALIAVLYTTVMPVAYAGKSANDQRASYRCASMNEPLQRVNVNLGGRRGFVQLDIPVTHSQPISISLLKQCLLQNGLMSKQELADYSKAVETCRRVHAQEKVQFSRGAMSNISTSKAFNFDSCLQDNLLN